LIRKLVKHGTVKDLQEKLKVMYEENGETFERAYDEVDHVRPLSSRKK
jgi:hypothetical protein